MEQLNRIELVGVVGRDAKITNVGDSAVASFSMATNYAYKDKDGNAVDETTWHIVRAWRGSRMPALEDIKKGTRLHVTGRLRIQRYTDSKGNERTCSEIVADTVNIIGENINGPTPMEKQDKTHKAHNVIASLVMADAERTLRDELRNLKTKTRPAHDIVEGGRKAMEALLQSDVQHSPQPLVEHMKDTIKEYIDRTLQKTDRNELILGSCTHENHTADGVYVETFRRLYRDENGAIIAEYSDHVADGTEPEVFYGDELDAFSLDELVEIANSIACLH